jgi:hypothetical protein
MARTVYVSVRLTIKEAEMLYRLIDNSAQDMQEFVEDEESEEQIAWANKTVQKFEDALQVAKRKDAAQKASL